MTAEAMVGSANSIVAEIREAVVNDEGGSGMTGGLSSANAVLANAAVLSSTRPIRLK